MKDTLTDRHCYTGFEKPVRAAYYTLLTSLLVARDYEADRFSILEPSCDGRDLSTECRKAELVKLYIDALNAGVDLTTFFDVNACGLSAPIAATITEQDALLKSLTVDSTITPIGTTGNVTINKASGTVNIAVGASSAVVTNSLVTANSIIHAVIRTNDSTFQYIDSVVPAAGSFTVRGNANATAATSVGFLVINPG